MGKEVKIGLSIIAVLLCVFGAVLFIRLRSGNDAPPVAMKKPTGEKTSDKQDDKDHDKQEKAKVQLKQSGSGSELKFGKRSPPQMTDEVQEKEGRYASSRSADEETSDYGWSESSDRSVPGESSQDRSPSADRYGRRYASGDGLGPLPSPPGYADNVDAEAGNMVADEPSATDGVAENEQPFPAALPLGAPSGQPGDGYRAAEDEIAEEESRTMNLAESDPFPPASNMTSPERSAYAETGADADNNVMFDRSVASDRSVSSDREPISSYDRTPRGASLEAAGSESQLMPISEPRDAAFGENGLQDRESMAGDFREEPSDSRFSPVSSRQPTTSVAADERSPEYGALSDSNYAGGGQDARLLNGAYFVQPNDSFASISKKLYGTEAYFQALHEYNRERFPNPDLLNVGDEIEAPDAAVLQRTYPQLCPKPRKTPSGRSGGNMLLASQGKAARGGRRYLVAEGDTLFHIAKRELGKASRWKEIYELNQDQLGEDFNYLSPGMELRLPGEPGDRPDPVADRLTPSRFRR